jgi:two-component system, NtrC family, sensor histidine kinase PilS
VQAAAGRHPRSSAGIDAVLRRELYFFALYRTFQSALLAFVVFSPWVSEAAPLRLPIAAQLVSAGYIAAAILLLLAMRRRHVPIAWLAGFGLALDIVVALFVSHAVEGSDSVVAMLLLVNIGAGAVLLPPAPAGMLTVLASLGVVGEYVYSTTVDGAGRDPAEPFMFAVTYLAAGALCHLLGRQLRTSTALADRRGQEVANLAHLNELIIRRMRTGVLVVGSDDRVRLMNEAAWNLLGAPSPERRELRDLSPALANRLARWRRDHVQVAEPIALAEDRQPVIPRMATLTVAEELFMIFLDDSSLISRRAEELTVSSLGRLAASIAHEVRNPLAAIKHSAQLLEESPDLPDMDRRLVEIMLSHCNRMNAIIENVLGLARRERSQPEYVDIVEWVLTFVEEFKQSRADDGGFELQALVKPTPMVAMVDPQQLYQVVTSLVHNATIYGKLPGEPARISISVRQSPDSGQTMLDVRDRGPGIPPKVAARVFEPFYTTSEMGSGLGLYIARQLCEANQATLEYLAFPGGGSTFRITLAQPVPLIDRRGVAPLRIESPVKPDNGAALSPAPRRSP